MTSSMALRGLLVALSAGWVSFAVAGYESRTVTNLHDGAYAPCRLTAPVWQ